MSATNWIKAWKRAVGSGRPKKPVRQLRLGVEALEDRTNPTTFTWNHGGADGNWSTAANWVGGVAPTAADTDAVIVFNTVDPNSVMDIVGMNVAQIDFESGSNVTLTLNTSLIIDGAGAAVNIEDNFVSTNVIAGPGSLVLTNADAVIEDNIFPGFLQISAPIIGTQGFTKTGIGTLILSTTVGNLYTGTTTVADGVLQLMTNTSNEGLSSNIVVGDGVGAAGSAILQFLAGTSTEIPDTATLTINSDGLMRVPTGSTDGVTTLNVDGGELNVAGVFGIQTNGSVTADGTAGSVIDGVGTLSLGGGTVTFDVATGPAANDLVVSAVISEATAGTNLTKIGTGSLQFTQTASNTYTGTTTVADGVLQVQTSTVGDKGLSSNIVVGDGVGAAGSAVLRLLSDYELPDSATLTINPDGQVNVPTLVDDDVTDLNVDGGELNIGSTFEIEPGGLVSSDGAVGSVIDGPGLLRADSGLLRFDVADGPGVTDLLVATSLAEVAPVSASLVKTGTGTLELAMTAPNTLTGATIIRDGVLLLNTSTTNAALSGTIVIGDNIGAAGSAVLRLVNSDEIADTASINVDADGLLDVTATASETVASLNLSSGGGFAIATGGAFSVLPVGAPDTINLTGGILTFNRTGPDVPIGQTVTLIDNLGTNPVTGTFTGLPEGATLTANGQEFTISYVGGDGNDVVLTPASPPPPPTPVVLAASGDNLGNIVVFDANTNVQYLKFRPFDTDASQYIGQMSIALGDVNGDGVPDLILGTRGKRAGKVKVFDGASIIAGIVPHPTDTIFVGFPLSPDGSAAHNPYKQAVTVAAADVNGDGIKDIIVATRTANSSIDNSVLPATVLAYAGANGAITGSILGSFQPFGTAKDGVYVTAGDTTGDGHAEVTVSSSTRSLMKIYQFSGGTFSQLGGDISPFGAIPFVSANGDGQVRAVNVGGSATVDFEVGLLDTSTGAVNLQLLDGTGNVIDSYTNGTGASFFAIDAVDQAADNNGQVMLARVSAAGGTSIDLLDPATGADNGTLDGFLSLSGKATLAGS